MRRNQRSETEIATPVVSWLEEQGWEVYTEVQPHPQGPIYDLVARRDGMLWLIEVKARFSAEVVAQAWSSKGAAHMVSVATPPLYLLGRRVRVQPFLLAMCQKEGIGIIEVRHFEWEPWVSVSEKVMTKKTDSADPALVNALSKHRKDFAAPPGNAEGKYWTPFQQTCLNLATYVKHLPGRRINDVVKHMQHHYQSDASAAQSLRKWVERGRLDGVVGQWKPWRGRKAFIVEPDPAKQLPHFFGIFAEQLPSRGRG